MLEIILELPSQKATDDFGIKLSKYLAIGDILYLSGEMGQEKQL